MDRLLAEATVPGIVAHELGPLAAHRLRRRGEPVPGALAREERAALLSSLTARPLLERVRALSDGPLLLIKGPEVAERYPGRARRFGDLDLLSPRAEHVHAALMDSGFVEVYDPEFEVTPEHHHLPPVRWEEVPLSVEVHKAPNWPPRAPRPPVEELFEARVPSALAIEGISAPAPVHHALVLAVHAWRHEPLRTIRDLLDVAVVAAPLEPRELELTARRWGIERVWRTTSEAIEAVFYGGRTTAPLRTWARSLSLIRERTRFERHLEQLLHGYWELPPHRATLSLVSSLGETIAPLPGETWGDKLRRVGRALRDPRAPVERRTVERRGAPDDRQDASDPRD